MTSTTNDRASIIRTERGLTIAGTRLTLYDVMDRLKAGYPHKFIRDEFDLSDDRLQAALAYIEAHRDEVELEYEEILRMAAETRQYWEERNRDRLARIAATPRSGYEAARIKLMQRRMKRDANQK